MAGKETGEEQFEPIKRALDGIRFGSVEITVHDARIVQIERREKTRFERSESKPSARKER
jgi:hypothetical protein